MLQTTFAHSESGLEVRDQLIVVGDLDVGLLTSAGASIDRVTIAELEGAVQRTAARLVLIGQSDEDALNAMLQAASALPLVTVLAIGEPTGETLSLADRSGVDAVVCGRPDPVSVARIAASFSARPEQTKGGGVSRLPPTVVSDSPAMVEVLRLALLAAPTESSVVIQGETGVGKEVVARTLHRFSPRRGAPFVAVNCAALSETLLHSELFGHEKGSFTGAAARHRGRFELADGGTLFLDEVGDLPASVQVSLLRVLQEKEFERVGGTEAVKVDVRVVAATHRDLEEEVRRGRFRADLYYRLNVLSLRVPPLRERFADVIALWVHFLKSGASEAGRAVPATSTAAERLLLRHDWPGNVREIHNAAQHALTMSTGDRIMPADLPSPIYESQPLEAIGRLTGLTLQEVERAAILQTYEALGTVKAAANALCISERKIHYRLKEYRHDHPIDTFESETAGGTPSSIRVLLAEDDDDLRWALTDFLREEGFEVVAVPDGRAVLERLGAAVLLERRNTPADIIVTDLRMPGLDGMQILESVRARGWSMPVVLMTAFADERLRKRALALGADAFLSKPVDVDTFQNTLRSLVEIAQ